MKQHLFFFLVVLFYLSANAQSSETCYTVITEKDTPVNSGRGGTTEPLRIVSINKQENSQVVSYSFDMLYQLFAAYHKKQLASGSLQLFQQQDTLKTKKLIQQYGLNWKKIIQLRDHPFQKPEVVKQLRIEHYPTYLLIDSTGKILLRTSKLEELTDVFQ